MIDINYATLIEIKLDIVAIPIDDLWTINFTKLIYKYFFVDNLKEFETILFSALTSIHLTLKVAVKNICYSFVSSPNDNQSVVRNWETLDKNDLRCNLRISISGKWGYKPSKLLWPYSFLDNTQKTESFNNYLNFIYN